MGSFHKREFSKQTHTFVSLIKLYQKKTKTPFSCLNQIKTRIKQKRYVFIRLGNQFECKIEFINSCNKYILRIICLFKVRETFILISSS